MNYHFQYADKEKIQDLLPALFDILYQNMGEDFPSGNTREDDFNDWLSEVRPAMEKSARQIVLMYSDASLIGFFQYYVNPETFMMEEMQIVKDFQGSGIFASLYSWLLPKLPFTPTYVEAYTDKRNLRSQAILEHLSFALCAEENDKFLHFKGEYNKLFSKYSV